MFCSKCGNKKETNNNFCTSCGHKEETTTTPNKFNFQNFLSFIKAKKSLIGIIAVIICLFAFKSTSSTPSKVSEKFLKLCLAGEFIEALDFTDAKDKIPTDDYLKLVATFAELEAEYDPVEASALNLLNVKTIEESDSAALVTFSYLLDDETDSENLTLRKIKNTWKIKIPYVNY